ncbi:UNKNOWN [Stylonychia lemnae]|uniref:Sulfatase-modifying factor enzyme-like domain-containing protein n=1 Tax=Stylonychia lemnae TaxID=5949 RepID=A0A078AMV5_STYLE|nr:UNKNOWN [Stylonychia lemnae]|eukprot:CDW82213.1 UNKNOWN [Stylonychia lemnae]
MSSTNLQVKDAIQKRQEFLISFQESFDSYDELFSLVKDEGLYINAEPLRHPLIFYFAHTAVFYINKLFETNILSAPEQRINKYFEEIFALGVDEFDHDEKLDCKKDWPKASEVRQYRQKVRMFMTSIIEKLELEDNTVIDQNYKFWIISMGIEHEKIHLDTSSVIMRMLPTDFISINQNNNSSRFLNIFKIVDEGSDGLNQNIIDFIKVQEQNIVVGRPKSEKEAIDSEHTENLEYIYGWDNEFGHERTTVDEFRISTKLITNAQYLRFVDDGGYLNSEYWSEEGWQWVQSYQASMPKFWIKTLKGYKLRLTFHELNFMPWNFPVEVNCLEANAYCRWLSRKQNILVRIPTENEYLVLYKRYQNELKSSQINNMLMHASPSPVDKYKQGDVYDLMGNVWQWTLTSFYPFQNFTKHSAYENFSTFSFDDKHNIIKGGNWISYGNMATQQTRQWFRRHIHQHSGFRVVLQDKNIKNNQDFLQQIAENQNDCIPMNAKRLQSKIDSMQD